MKHKCISLLTFLFSTIAMLTYQFKLYHDYDVTWLLHCSQLLLQGKHYYYSFFDTDPPLILLFNIPAVLLAKFSGLSLFKSFVIYLFLISSGVLLLCNHLLKSLFPRHKNKQTYLLCLLIILVIAIPLRCFGEREVISFTLLIPYLLLLLNQLEKTISSRFIRILCAVLAAIAICIKPYFLFAIIFIEGFYLFKKKSLKCYWRLEPIIIIALMIIYLVGSYYFFPLYFHKILPLSLQLYTPYFYRLSLSTLLVNAPGIWISLILFMTFLLSITDKTNRNNFSTLFFLAGLGYFIAFLIGGKAWYYHGFPALYFSLIAFIYCLVNSCNKLFTSKKSLNIKLLFVSFISSMVLLLSIFYVFDENYFNAYLKSYHGFQFQQLINFTNNTIKDQSILVISVNLDQQLFRNYTQAKLTSRFPSLLLVPGLIELSKDKNSSSYKQLHKEFFSLYMQDIRKSDPKFIFVFDIPYCYQNKNSFSCIHLDDYLLKNKCFKKFFSQFHLIKKIGLTDVYQRN